MSNSGLQLEAPRVSVIMASYNHALFVGEAVSSVLEQSIADLELLVVDDASTDATPDIVAAVEDPRLTLIRQAHNRQAHPRNLALELARGHYVAIQNSDDVWEPHKLARQLEYLEGNPDCLACFTGAVLIDETGKPTSGTWAEGVFTTANRTSVEWLRQFFFAGNCLPLTSVLLRRDVLQQLGGFRASLIGLSDYDLWIQLAARGELHIVDEPLTRIRIVRGKNLSRPGFRNHNRSRIETAYVLQRYAEPVLLERFAEIFPEWSDLDTEGARKVCLAEAAKRHRMGAELFAETLVAQVMEDPVQRAQAVEKFGTGFIQTAIRMRSKYAFEPSSYLAWRIGQIRRRLGL